MMLTSGGQHGDAQRCSELGIAAYLLKPIRQVELREAIARVLSAGGASGAAPMITRYSLREKPPAGKSLTILLAEDNLVNQKLACRLLEKRNHAVTLVSNGKEALAALENNSYDLVLMDLQMPEMDGLEATRILRERERGTGHHQPVVAMTALAMTGDKERCLAAGMDGYLSKPIRPLELDEVLDGYVAPMEETPEHADRAPDAGSAVDGALLLDRIDGDLTLLAELVELFRAEHPVNLRALQQAIDAQNADGLSGAGHALKGALGNLSALAASSMAAELEAFGKARNFTQAQDTLDRLTLELGQVMLALEALCPAHAQ
jgi:CheY-like chemotaxis protein